MSGLLYSGKTLNNVFITDMVDPNEDLVWYNDDKTLFVRFCAAKDENSEKHKSLPALCVFKNKKKSIFTPIYAKILTTDHEQAKSMWDLWNDTSGKLFMEEKDQYQTIGEFWEEVEQNQTLIDSYNGEK